MASESAEAREARLQRVSSHQRERLASETSREEMLDYIESAMDERERMRERERACYGGGGNDKGHAALQKRPNKD